MGPGSCGVNLGQDFNVDSPFCLCQFSSSGPFQDSFAVHGTDVLVGGGGGGGGGGG